LWLILFEPRNDAARLSEVEFCVEIIVMMALVVNSSSHLTGLRGNYFMRIEKIG
jgi:hypothetical protein